VRVSVVGEGQRVGAIGPGAGRRGRAVSLLWEKPEKVAAVTEMSIWSVGATVILALIGMISAWGLTVNYARDREIARSVTTVVGTVVERLARGGGGRNVRVAYTVDGVDHDIVSNQRSSFDVGTQLVVRYVPGRPKRARLEFSVAERWTGTLGSLFGTVLGFGGAIATAILGLCRVF
jgi:hypothetical protein